MATNIAQQFLRDRRGLAAVEYVILTTGMAIVVVGAMAASGAGVSNKFNAVSSGMGTTAAADAGLPVDAEPVAMPISRPISRPIGRPIAMPISMPVAADF